MIGYVYFCMVICPICARPIRPGEDRTPDPIGPIHSTCEDRIIEHDCGQRLLKMLDKFLWLRTAHDATPGNHLQKRGHSEPILRTSVIGNSLYIQTDSRQLSADRIDNDPRYVVIG